MIIEKLQQDLKDAMRSKDAVRLRTIRSLRAAILQKEIDLRTDGAGSIPHEDALAVIQKQAKQRRDAILQYEAAAREDLKQIEVDELAVIESYLPKQLSAQEIRSAVDTIIQETAAEGMKDMGRVMGAAMQALKGQADGKVVQEVVRAALTSI